MGTNLSSFKTKIDELIVFEEKNLEKIKRINSLFIDGIRMLVL